MATDPGVPRTRRALLAGGAGGLAALVASALGRPLAVRAADGDPVLAGKWTHATVTTAISTTQGIGLHGRTSDPDGVGVDGYATATSGTTFGVRGASFSPDGHGVVGRANATSGFADGLAGYSHSVNGTGVYGEADATSGATYGVRARSASSGGIGVYACVPYATGGRTAGVWGQADNTGGTGVRGLAYTRGTGVYGSSGAAGWDAPGPPKTGVYGYAAEDAASRGVHGKSTAGRGVYGQATSGTGVYASATTGYALRAVGRVKLDKCAGVATIAAGAKAKTVTPGIDLVSTSAVVATLQGSAGGTTTVHRVTVNPTANSFTIYLTANSTANVKVAWHVFG